MIVISIHQRQIGRKFDYARPIQINPNGFFSYSNKYTQSQAIEIQSCKF